MLILIILFKIGLVLLILSQLIKIYSLGHILAH